MANSFKDFARKITEINQRFSKPHIEMSPAVKFALVALRIYLLFLVSLMIYKFALLVS
jgi:hypothetical protein